MQLCAILTADDLTSIIEQLTPLRVAIRPRRVIALGRPAKVELVAGAGLRVGGDARFTWDVGGLIVPVNVRVWQVLFVPSFVARKGGHVLAFEPILELLDLKRAPMFLDDRIAQAVRDGLGSQRGKLAWDFEKVLSLVRPLPAKVTPTGEWRLGPTGGSVTVTAADIRVTLDFGLHVHRDSQRAPAVSKGSEKRESAES